VWHAWIPSELPEDGGPKDIRWLSWGANGTYLLGQFDGTFFRRDGDPQRYGSGGDSYAAQT
jgi:fructan beta-fructosidase